MNFERGKDTKETLGIGIRGRILEAFRNADFLFQKEIPEEMVNNPSSWKYKRRSWMKKEYYVIEVIHPGRVYDKVWSYYIPFATNQIMLFHNTEKSLREEARRLINRIHGKPYKPDRPPKKRVGHIIT